MKRELYWIANYQDGSQLKQYENNRENKYYDIDRDNLVRFDLLDYETNKAVYSYWVREGEQLIYRRRTLRPVIVTEQRPIQVIYIVGYKKKTMTNAGVKEDIVLNYIYQDGSVALDGERNNLELFDFEK